MAAACVHVCCSLSGVCFQTMAAAAELHSACSVQRCGRHDQRLRCMMRLKQEHSNAVGVSDHGMAVVAVQRCVLRAHPHVLLPFRAFGPPACDLGGGTVAAGYGPRAVGVVQGPLWYCGAGCWRGGRSIAGTAVFCARHTCACASSRSRCEVSCCAVLCSRHCGAVPLLCAFNYLPTPVFVCSGFYMCRIHTNGSCASVL